MADFNNEWAHGDHLKVVIIRDCIAAKHLQTLCFLGDIEGASTIEKATKANVKKWFDNLMSEGPRELDSASRLH